MTALAPYYPALSDMAGYLKGRAGGWPHLFKDEKDGHRAPAKVRTAAYYDVVNFARRVKAPGLYSWGWNDEVCPPTSMHAAYNVVTAPKELLLAAETGHNTVPEETEKVEPLDRRARRALIPSQERGGSRRPARRHGAFILDTEFRLVEDTN